MQEKILVGHKLRRLRQSMELSQTAMSEILDISPSYLNLLEHNQRPLTVALLLRLGNSFDIDLKEFAEDDSAALNTSITEIFADHLLAEERCRGGNSRYDHRCPGCGGRSTPCFRPIVRYGTKSRSHPPMGASQPRSIARLNLCVIFCSRRIITLRFLKSGRGSLRKSWHFISTAVKSRHGKPLSQYYQSHQQHRWPAWVLPVKVMHNQLRRYDQHRREILLSEALRRPQRQFHLLVQYALLSQQDKLDDIYQTLASEDQQTVSLLKVTLAAYFAGAVMMHMMRFSISQKFTI